MATQAREAPTLGVGPAAPTAATLAPAAAGANTAAAGRARLVLEAPLTRLTVGMWASRHHRACQLLILPEQEQLVVLCDRRSTAPRSPSRFSLASHVHKRVAAKSPFASGHSAYRAAGCVHAFEVPFHAIRGMDYNNPLCHEARLVLEAVHLRKREFATVGAGWVEGAGRVLQLAAQASVAWRVLWRSVPRRLHWVLMLGAGVEAGRLPCPSSPSVPPQLCAGGGRT